MLRERAEAISLGMPTVSPKTTGNERLLVFLLLFCLPPSTLLRIGRNFKDQRSSVERETKIVPDTQGLMRGGGECVGKESGKTDEGDPGCYACGH